MGSKTTIEAPPAPDPQPMADAQMAIAGMSAEQARMMYSLGKDQLAFQKSMWADQKEMQQSVLDVQLPMMENFKEWSEEDRDRWETEFKPLEDAFLKEAKEYDKPWRREKEARAAKADVTRGFAAARANTLRQLEGYGIDPSQTRHQALDVGVRTQEAAVKAGAANMARQRVEDKGLALKSAAINMGKGLPAQAVSTGTAASNVGNQAIQGGNSINSTYNQGVSASGQFFGYGNDAMRNASGAINSAGGLLNSGFQNSLASWEAQNAQNQQGVNNLWGGLGTMAGIAAGFGFAEGGDVGNVIDGETGEVVGAGGPKSDAIAAQLSDGEYVIPADVKEYKGVEFFDKLVNKSREAMGVPEEATPTMMNGIPMQGQPNE